ncbi:MAG TPA: hypothetical protein VLJ58_21255 [Ramlibacter sp.]|nr:hypothetical protein [Ramlibacter sp.]
MPYFDDNEDRIVNRRPPLHLAREDITCKHCGAECYWQETYGADGRPKAKLFEDGKPHVCKPSADDFEVLA